MMNRFMRPSVKAWLLLGLFAVLGIAFWGDASPALAHHTNCDQPNWAQICDVRVSPPLVTWGNKITVSWTQRNQVQRTVILWRCLGYSNDKRCIETVILPPERSSSSSVTWTIPACMYVPQYPGRFKILVQIWDDFGSSDVRLSNDQEPTYDLFMYPGPDPCLYSIQVDPTWVRHGATQTVTWSSLNQQSYQLELFKSSGQYVRTIASRTYSTAQSRAWTVPADLAPGNYYIKITIWNGYGQSKAILSSTFTVPNRAPVLDNGGDPSLGAINEDPGTNYGTSVSTIIASVPPRDMITDPDPNAREGLAIIAVDNSHGAWQYSTNAGSSWTAFGSPTTSSARLLDSDANTRVRFVPKPNFNGMVNPGITFRAWDRTSGSNGGTANTTANGGATAFSAATETASIAINAVNDAPGFLPGPDQVVDEDAGLQTIRDWAIYISPGPADEGMQTVNFTVTNNNPALFANQPALSPDGTLTYQSAADASGRAAVTVWLRDNGGTANGGVDSSPPQTFIITVKPVNDPPSFTKGPDQIVDEDAGPQTVLQWATNISSGPPDEGCGLLVFRFDSDKRYFFSSLGMRADGNLHYQTARNVNGSATVTVWLQERSSRFCPGPTATSDPQTFVVTVNPIDDPPEPMDDTITTIEDMPVSIPVLINDRDPEGDALSVVAVGIPSHGSATLNPDQTVSYTPTSNFDGSDSFSYVVSEGDLSSTASVNIAVIPVNDPPSFNKGPDQTVDEDAGLQTIPGWATNILAGPTEEVGQSLTFIMTNDNPGLFASQPAIAPDGTLTYQPTTNANGSATVTVRLQDNGGTADGGIDTSDLQTFIITVNFLNDAPDAVDDNGATPTDMPSTIAVLANDSDPENDPLTVTAVGIPANGTAMLNLDNTVTYTPNLSFTGVDFFNYTVSDPGGLTDTAYVTVTVGALANADILPKLIVVKHVINDNGGTATAADFTLNVTGDSPNPAPFPGDEGGTIITLKAGDYRIDETGPTGYAIFLSGDCSGTITTGETRTCIITSDDLQFVDIDILPHAQQNRIHINTELGPNRNIQVAILSSPDFDAPSVVDRTSLTFGRAGDEESLISCFDHDKDVNHDGLQDLVCLFRGRLTGFQVGDTNGNLQGTTLDGARFEGSDSVKLVTSGEDDDVEDD